MNVKTECACRELTLKEAIENKNWEMASTLAKEKELRFEEMRNDFMKEHSRLTQELNETKHQLKIMTRYMMWLEAKGSLMK